MKYLVFLIIFINTSVFCLPKDYSNWFSSLVKEKIDNGAKMFDKSLDIGNDVVQLVERLKGDATKLITGFATNGVTAGVNLSSQGLHGATALASRGLHFINSAIQFVGCPVSKAITKFATDLGINSLNTVNAFGQSGLKVFGKYVQGKLTGVNDITQRKYDAVSKFSHDSTLLGKKGVKAGANSLKSAVDIVTSAVETLRNIFSIN